MRPLILDLAFRDDRQFVLEIWEPPPENPAQGWTVVTRRNVPGYPPFRVDKFPTEPEAAEYYKKVVVLTPRVSLDLKSPEPPPTIEQYKAWLVAENLFDPILNPNAPRPDP